ncbi:hypothetical protein ABW19_dt0201587 [Dactylella cylindrospora]|nr:hypothetical protein ABW19_dt0201587 [Dactylella cylindrospora]
MKPILSLFVILLHILFEVTGSPTLGLSRFFHKHFQGGRGQSDGLGEPAQNEAIGEPVSPPPRNKAGRAETAEIPDTPILVDPDPSRDFITLLMRGKELRDMELRVGPYWGRRGDKRRLSYSALSVEESDYYTPKMILSTVPWYSMKRILSRSLAKDYDQYYVKDFSLDKEYPINISKEDQLMMVDFGQDSVTQPRTNIEIDGILAELWHRQNLRGRDNEFLPLKYLVWRNPHPETIDAIKSSYLRVTTEAEYMEQPHFMAGEPDSKYSREYVHWIARAGHRRSKERDVFYAMSGTREAEDVGRMLSNYPFLLRDHHIHSIHVVAPKVDSPEWETLIIFKLRERTPL